MICIDVTGERIDIVVTKDSKQNLTVESGSTLNVPPDLFSSAGEINLSVLENCLRDSISNIPEKKVIMSFSFLPTIYSVLHLHKERNRQLQRNAVESQVYANISPDDYYVDYFETVSSEPQEGKTAYVSYAMPKKVVDGSYDILKKLGKTPVALVPSQHAAENFMSRFFADKTISLAKLSAKSITLHLLNPPDNMITRNVVIDSVGGESLDVVAGMGASANPQTMFIQNLEKLNSYQSIKFPGKPIEQVLIFGNNVDSGLPALVESSVALPCSLLSSLNKNFASCAPVYTLGALLSMGSKEINFFSIDRSATANKKAKTKKPINVPLLVALIIILANIGVVVGISSVSQQMSNLVAEKEAELNSPETVALLEQYSALREDFVGKLKSESALIGLESAIAALGEFDRDILTRTVAATPEGVEVLSFSYSGFNYNFSCTGQTEQQAADYVEALIGLNIFEFVGYYGYSDSGSEVTFTITGELSSAQ